MRSIHALHVMKECISTLNLGMAILMLSRLLGTTVLRSTSQTSVSLTAPQ